MEPFIGQIMLFAGNYAPRGWAKCDGQLLSIRDNSALFSILGTTYGGDGKSTFRLPDLRGRAPIHMGQGPALSNRNLGAKAGSESATLTTANLPNHSHSLRGSTAVATARSPAGGFPAAPAVDGARTAVNAYGNSHDATLSADAVAHTGGGQPVDLMPPFQVINYCIALSGIYPGRN